MYFVVRTGRKFDVVSAGTVDFDTGCAIFKHMGVFIASFKLWDDICAVTTTEAADKFIAEYKS